MTNCWIRLEKAEEKLLQRRKKEDRPLLDDKILLGWNALMNTALCKAYAATGNERIQDGGDAEYGIYYAEVFKRITMVHFFTHIKMEKRDILLFWMIMRS